MQKIIHWLRRIKIYLLGARKTRPEDIPRLLDRETLEKAMAEARFLVGRHAVEVRSLEPGEAPGLPRPAGEAPL